MLGKMRYRLALDLGSTSLGWAMIRLDNNNNPCAIIKAGVRIFSDGRNPKDGTSLAVTRRNARAMRRRRDRLLKRKTRMIQALIKYGFFPLDKSEQKNLETLNPYRLRAEGLDRKLEAYDFGRALFHINQRRGFKSNRKTDKKENDSSALKASINRVKAILEANESRTVGEWLYKRMQMGNTVRARYRESKTVKDDGKPKIEKSYDLYIDRAMVEAEFDALWQKQAEFNPALFHEEARLELKNVLLYQRKLRPVKPGRCTFLSDEERAPLALPSVQRFRLYQEVNNLRILQKNLDDAPLTLDQRNELIKELERKPKCSFTQIKKILGLSGTTQFNSEDPKRQELKGNTTSAILSKDIYFGKVWFDFPEAQQDEVVRKLLTEENEEKLVEWLKAETHIDEQKAEIIGNVALPEGYGSLSEKAIALILPILRSEVNTYDKAVQAAGFDHHSHISPSATGEIWESLPYYGQPLQRHVGFGTNNPKDNDEKRYGKIANPTVHIGLNQVRLAVNNLIKRYGHPSEVIIEVARDLKQSREQRKEENERQAKNQKRNAQLRTDIANALQISEELVTATDLHKMILWEELNPSDAMDRCCPYTGTRIGKHMLLSDEVEIEHILPFSQTLDDSLNNKTVAIRAANRVKGNQTPWDAFGKQAITGFDYTDILQRAEKMPRNKRYRFGENGYQKWLRDDANFLARALNDTRYLSKIAKEYVSLICPKTRVIPGQMTAMLRGKFGLNHVLGLNGEKNRNDHRHHAVDACVIGVTDQGLMQRFANASKVAREKHLDRLVEEMPLPWPTYFEHAKRAVNNIWVSHKPDHSHEGAMHNDTAYGLLGNGQIGFHKMVDGKREYIKDNLKVIEFTSMKAKDRHGILPNGELRPYKGYKGDSNYCIEIVKNEKGKWEGEVISTFDAYQVVRKHGVERLRHPHLSLSEKPLMIRLMINDMLRLNLDGNLCTMRIVTLSGNGQIFMAAPNEANVDSRNRDKQSGFSYVSKTPGALQKLSTRKISISPIGEINDPGFRG